MSDTLIVQFVGYEVLSLVRQYKFSVRESRNEAREFTLTIANASFDCKRAGCRIIWEEWTDHTVATVIA